MTEELAWQPSLFDTASIDIDESFAGILRIDLDPTAWVEHLPGWVQGSDELFAEILDERDWGQRSRHMYEGRVLEPRLTSSWVGRSGEKLEPPVLERMRATLSARYEVEFDSVGFNLYRDGSDSVAWHADKIKKEIDDPIVALVSLGAARKFLLRPEGGGASKSFMLGRGDLFVTGGKTQRTWEHSIPKVARAGPRISLAFRHHMDPSVYANKRVETPER